MIKTGKFLIPIVIMMSLAATLPGCSTANPESPLSLVDASGNHPDGWIEAHRQYAEPDGSLCMDCHGDNLDGGITRVSCSTATRNGQGCHANGPGLHSLEWLDKSSPDFHALAYSPAAGSCNLCHDPAQPSLPPVYNCLDCHFSEDGSQRIPDGSLYSHGDTTSDHQAFTGTDTDVCVNCHTVNINFANQASCHNCHEFHEKPYLDHNLAIPTSGDFTSNCSFCHAITGTSPQAGAPVCVSCHTVGSPYTQTNCTSCHGDPPDTGKHDKHDNEGADCDECHLNAGSGNGLNHYYDGEVDVEFSVSPFTYNPVLGECTGTCHIGSESKDHNNKDW